jgi:hypothetical protein
MDWVKFFVLLAVIFGLGWGVYQIGYSRGQWAEHRRVVKNLNALMPQSPTFKEDADLSNHHKKSMKRLKRSARKYYFENKN